LGQGAMAMIPTPFWFEQDFTPEDFQKLGQLSLRWSHIDHIIGSCLKVMLRLSDEEAVAVVFPLTTDRRLSLLKELAKGRSLFSEADHALRELWSIMPAIQLVRNNVAHAVIYRSLGDDPIFHLRSKERSFTRRQVFETEELTNYAAHAALVLRYALGEKGPEGAPSPLPERPRVPKFLQREIRSWKAT
jgi:hypothetical protein